MSSRCVSAAGRGSRWHWKRSEIGVAAFTSTDPRTIAILSCALCGFANFASIAALTGGFSVVAPERRTEVARHGLRVVFATTLSNLMSVTIAVMFLTLN